MLRIGICLLALTLNRNAKNRYDLKESRINEVPKMKKDCRLKIVVMDVDGTLTDGSINIGQNGELYKSFYCKDGTAIVRALKEGLQPVILTSRTSDIVKKRAEELGIIFVLQGANENKSVVLKSFMDEHGLEKENMAYIGDDINDIEGMRLCKIVGCPIDAADEVKTLPHIYVTRKEEKGQ